MSTRWMAVQFVGDTLRLPVVNEGDMDKPFGSSVVDREISRVVINPFSDDPQVFVSESEYAKLRELVADMWFWHYEGHIDSESQERQMLHIDAVIQRMHELGVEVPDGD